MDEFQDSSAREMALIDTLSAKYRNLMIVGDPDQNIYEWRGSNVKLLVEFDKTHPGTKTIFLNQNYRSTPEILLCANRLIEKNTLLYQRQRNNSLLTVNNIRDAVISIVNNDCANSVFETGSIAFCFTKRVKGKPVSVRRYILCL